jgi:hypothetical protein
MLHARFYRVRWSGENGHAHSILAVNLAWPHYSISAGDVLMDLMLMLMMYILVVARVERHLMAPFCNYDEMIYTNPSGDGELAVLGRYLLLLWW